MTLPLRTAYGFIRGLKYRYCNGLDPWFGLGHVTFIAMATGAHGAWPVCI